MLAIADELTEDGLVLRYKVDNTDTGFEGKEGTFTICSWWLVSALAMIGEIDRARDAVQKVAVVCRPAAPLRRRDRCHNGRAPRELPPGLHASGPDRRGIPAHRSGDRPRLNHSMESTRAVAGARVWRGRPKSAASASPPAIVA